ncbi:Arm DNA-binding domain-containing protein [Methylobacterium frigidaeris]|uniref:Integrase DNA-binding domain-containing protein n=1 Tax=Methylobacterium frigidaeris TaxID=2038277 RepID=A0AA37HES3_9HYPH|nr:Arm DNA-binding domain-containing protein [Methylobacterium frigidaeris]PIK72779.1 hypothetical protein CS379_12105 [Methylobacterium frigidaeris]GJD64424.1 hypothetical protein MPEAHAMD_4606 [Methylobacterium frigidaeris]
MAKITKRAVEAAEPNGRDYFLWCDELPGFGVRIFASGRRSYLIQYRAGGRSRRVTIGLHGALTADEARREAKALLGQVARGEDPAEERVTRRAAMTVADLCTAYVTAAEAGLIMGKGGQAKKDSTLYVDRGRIERHIKPLLGKRLVAGHDARGLGGQGARPQERMAVQRPSQGQTRHRRLADPIADLGPRRQGSLRMSNIIRFPAGRPVPAERIPREQFERLAGLALDVVDQILVLLDADRGGPASADGATPIACDDRLPGER